MLVGTGIVAVAVAVGGSSGASVAVGAVVAVAGDSAVTVKVGVAVSGGGAFLPHAESRITIKETIKSAFLAILNLLCCLFD
jgi:hypothetical protein